MATAPADLQPVVEAQGSKETTADATSAIATWETPSVAVHPQSAEIVRQIDYYFSDDILRGDAHLLGLFKEGNGTVSLNEVLSFRKMRQFKPKPAVKEAIKLSKIVEIVKVGKKDRLRRRHPLAKSITVVPKIDGNKPRYVVPEDKPWMTKALMKPTGWEEYATSGPIDPKEYGEDRMEYNPENSFTERIETAVRKFTARRKMHQETRLIFVKYLVFGGMECANQFTGGTDNHQRDQMTKKEIAESTIQFYVSERALDGLFEEKPGYIVDFEATAKGFLSSQFPAICNWYDGKQVMTATNVLRNFYNYLLLHDVCPEYNTQLHAARKICDLAEDELLKLAVVDTRLPGGFNKACSTLFEGNYADLNAASGDWVVDGDDIGWTKEDAKTVFLTGIFAYGTEEQLKRVESINNSGEDIAKAIKVVNEEESIGLEVLSVELVTDAASKVYEDVRFNNTLVKPMGKLRCRRWEVPHAKREDLPEWVMQMRKEEDEFEFLLEDETLKHCYPGMKMEASVQELDIGVKFIDYYEAIYVSFFTWLCGNERIRDWKEPGPPLSWMERANAKKTGDAVGEFAGDGDEPGEDEIPD